MQLHLTIVSLLGFFMRFTGKPVVYAAGYAYIILVTGLFHGNEVESQFSTAFKMFVAGIILFGLLHRYRKTAFMWWFVILAGVLSIEFFWGLQNLILYGG